MKILISRTPDNKQIAVVTDLTDIDSPTEITQIITEIEILKQRLIEMYEYETTKKKV